MTDDLDITDEEVERVRRALGIDEWRSSGPFHFDQKQLAMASKLVGIEDVGKIERRAKAGRRVKIAPPLIKVEWWVVPHIGNWRIQRIVNGHREDPIDGFDTDELNRRLCSYRNAGIMVSRFRREEDEPEEDRKPVARRKSFQERFGNIDRKHY